MKTPYLFLVSALALSACAKTVIYNYDGDKVITGDGGFHEYTFTEEKSIFDFSNTPVKKIDFYVDGLPKDKKCTLLGFISDENQDTLSRAILDMGGNTATQSGISDARKFEQGSGVFNTNMTGLVQSKTKHTLFGTSTTITKGYNIFDCK